MNLGLKKMGFLCLQTDTGIFILDLENRGQEINGKAKFVKQIHHLHEYGFPITGAMCSIDDCLCYIGGAMVSRDAPPPRHLSRATLDKTHGHGGISANIYKVDLSLNQPLQLLPSLMTSPKPNPIAQVIDNKLYVLAGRALFSIRPTPPAPSFEVFDPACNRWSPLDSPPLYVQCPVPCNIVGHFVIGSRLYIATNHGDLWYYDTTANEPRHQWKDHSSLMRLFLNVVEPDVDEYHAVEWDLFARHGAPIHGQAYVNENYVIMFSFQREFLFAYLLSTDLDEILCYQRLTTSILGEDVVSASKELMARGFVLKLGGNQTCALLPFIDVLKDQFSLCTTIFNWKIIPDYPWPIKRAKLQVEQSSSSPSLRCNSSSPPLRDFLTIEVVARYTIDLSHCIGGLDDSISRTLIL